MTDKLTAMISSTARDLPEYRDEVKEACLRADIFPKMMEQLPAIRLPLRPGKRSQTPHKISFARKVSSRKPILW